MEVVPKLVVKTKKQLLAPWYSFHEVVGVCVCVCLVVSRTWCIGWCQASPCLTRHFQLQMILHIQYVLILVIVSETISIWQLTLARFINQALRHDHSRVLRSHWPNRTPPGTIVAVVFYLLLIGRHCAQMLSMGGMGVGVGVLAATWQ